jgi:acetylornithine/succinyldiaminopimelate/putrescine aminotransferase
MERYKKVHITHQTVPLGLAYMSGVEYWLPESQAQKLIDLGYAVAVEVLPKETPVIIQPVATKVKKTTKPKA